MVISNLKGLYMYMYLKSILNNSVSIELFYNELKSFGFSADNSAPFLDTQ